MKKKNLVMASATVLTLAAATFAVPSVYAKTTDVVKGMGQRMMERGAGMHREAFDNTKFLEEQANMLGITVDDLKSRLESGKSIKDIVSDLGISEEIWQAKMQAQREAHQTEMKAKIQQEVTDGKLTQAQADEMLARMERGPQGGPGERGQEGRGPMGKGMKDDAKFLEEQASILGITADDLKARLESGKTMKDIASDFGISEETLKVKMEEKRAEHQAEMKAKIQRDVTDGKITQEQADQMIERMANPKKHGFGGGRGRDLWGGNPPSGEQTSQTVTQ